MPVPDPFVEQQLQRLRRLKELRAAYGIYTYNPSPKQQKFHEAARFKRRYLRTGNRFGKSTCGSAEDVAYALGARVWVSKDDPLYQLGIPQRSTRGVILVADWDKSREIFTNQEDGDSKGKLFKWLPKDRIHGIHKNQAGEVDCVEVKSIWGGVSTIYLDTVKSFMSNPMGQESSQWDWIHVDEPVPKAMWDANARGLIDTGGSAWFTCTPITEQWINEYFLPPASMRGDFSQGGSMKNEMWIMTGSTFDNPRLKVEDIQLFAESLTDDQRQARLFGVPGSSSGLIYKEFSMDEHVYRELPKGWKDFDAPPDNYTIRVFIDPHPKTPHAVQFWATAPTGESFCYAEIFSACLIEDLCKQILTVLNGRVPYQVAIDPFAFIESPMDGRCYADTFMDFGINVERAPKELKAGITIARQELAKKLGPKNKQHAMLQFCSSCTETIREFFLYAWDEKKEKPIDKDDHMMECFYRACMIGLDWVDTSDRGFKEDHKDTEDRYLDLTPFAYGSLKDIAA